MVRPFHPTRRTILMTSMLSSIATAVRRPANGRAITPAGGERRFCGVFLAKREYAGDRRCHQPFAGSRPCSKSSRQSPIRLDYFETVEQARQSGTVVKSLP
jgi:hypothetical protein